MRDLPWSAKVAVTGLAVIAALLLAGALLMPWSHCGGHKAREAVLRTDLRTFRDVIGQYREDHGGYPGSLEALVREEYLRSIPVDPITRSSATWTVERVTVDGRTGVADVHSGSDERGADGRRYSEW